MNGKLKIQVSKTADGLQDYVQVMSEDMVSVNVVLVADFVEVRDDRIAAEVVKLRKANPFPRSRRAR